MKKIEALLQQKGGINLDIACGHNKQPGWVGIDIQDLPGVDIVHDLYSMPWPLPDESVLNAAASHFLEHIPPVVVTEKRTRFLFLEFMNEVWRVLKVGGAFAITAPHGHSEGMLQDPTHINFMNETTWFYFDPLSPQYGNGYYNFYQPKPWQVTNVYFNPVGNLEVIMLKRQDDPSYHPVLGEERLP